MERPTHTQVFYNHKDMLACSNIGTRYCSGVQPFLARPASAPDRIKKSRLQIHDGKSSDLDNLAKRLRAENKKMTRWLQTTPILSKPTMPQTRKIRCVYYKVATAF